MIEIKTSGGLRAFASLWNEQLWGMIQSLEKENESLRKENAALRRELNSIVESAFRTMTRNCHLRQELLERAEAHEEAVFKISKQG
jgi:regulator of replication initiation timing